MLPHLSSTFDGIRIFVHVKLFSSVSCVKSVREDGHLEVFVAAKPKKGEANAELLKYLASFFEISISSLSIVSGHKSRNKVILVKDISLDKIEDKLSHAFSDDGETPT